AATLAIAWFTLTLKWATDRLWNAGELQRESSERIGQEQSFQMAVSAKAAQISANVSERTLVATHRPWIAVEISVEEMFYDINGLNVLLLTSMTNVGNGPARSVIPLPMLHIRVFDEPSVYDVHQENRVSTRNANTPGTELGLLIFPGKTKNMQ